MNTRLRDAIQALLSEHLRGPLLAADARSPVLGSTSIARPDGRVASEPAYVYYRVLDDGLAKWNFATPEYPIYIYTGDSLNDYLSGLEENPHPTYDGEKYQSSVYTNATPAHIYRNFGAEVLRIKREAQGARYTGLMRLAVQAKVAARLPLSGLCFQDIPDSTGHGIVFDPDSQPWSVYISGDDVYCARLIFDGKDADNLDTSFEDLDLEDQADVIKLSRFFARLKPSPGGIGDPIFTLSDASPGAPFYHGWKFSYIESKAAIVKVRTIEGYEGETYHPATDPLPTHEESAVFVITIGWTLVDGAYVPSASESTHTGWTKSRRRNFVNNLWIPVESDSGGDMYLCSYFGQPANHEAFNAFSTTTAPQYCWYKKDGALHVVTHKGNSITYLSGSSYDNHDYRRPGGGNWWCSMKSGIIETFDSNSRVRPVSLESFSCTDYPLVGGMLYESGNNMTTRNWDCADDGREVLYDTGYYQQAYNRSPGDCYGASGVDTYWCKTRVKFLRLTGTDKTGSVSSLFAESLIIDPYDAEHVIITKRFSKRNNYTEVWNLIPNGNSGGWYSAKFEDVRNSNTYGPYLLSTTDETSSQGVQYNIQAGWLSRVYQGPSDTTTTHSYCAIVGSSGSETIDGFGYDDLSGFFPLSTAEAAPLSVNTWYRGSFMGGGTGMINNEAMSWNGFPTAELFSSVYVGGA